MTYACSCLRPIWELTDIFFHTRNGRGYNPSGGCIPLHMCLIDSVMSLLVMLCSFLLKHLTSLEGMLRAIRIVNAGAQK